MMKRIVTFAGRDWVYNWWAGQQLRGTIDRPVSVDLESAKIKGVREPLPGEAEDDVPLNPLDIPVPALGMACDSSGLYLIHPTKFSAFIKQHKQTHWVLHNAAFDYWVLMKHADSDLTREYLWQLAEKDFIHDTMIFDMLLQLAQGRYRRQGTGGEQKLYPTNLGVLVEEWQCGELDKTDPYRTKFGNFIGLTEAEIDAYPDAEKYFEYALKDVLACYQVFPKQRAKGLELMKAAGWTPDRKKTRYEMRPDAVDKFGVLSEAVQVKASLVLAELSRTPIRIDLERRQQLEDLARQRHSEYLKVLIEREPALVKKTSAKYRTVTEGKGKSAVKRKELVREEQVVYTAKAGVPSFNTSVLVAVLHDEAAKLGVSVPISKGKEARVSISTKQWKQWADRSEFIKAWCGLEDEGKRIEDLRKIAAPVVYSKYDLMKVTGRTGSGHYAEGRTGRLLIPSLNIQNVKRDNSKTPDQNLRPLFLAPPGHLWAAVDYGYIEFRAMAAVSRALYGESVMAEVTINHTLHGSADPHQMTAAAVDGTSIEEFLAQDYDTMKLKRQNSKPANFGLMGGMGAKTFVEYAKAAGVKDIDVEKAKTVKKAWKSLYKEMNKYLEGSAYEGLLWETGKKSGPRLNDQQAYRLSKFLRNTEGADPDAPPEFVDDDGDAPYEPDRNEKELFWEVLAWAAKHKGDAATQEDVRKRRVTQRVRRLTYYRSCSLTGRIRNHCSYCEERNYRFQSISADGAKLALFKLMRRGYKLLNFVHDEIGVAVPVGRAEAALKEIEKIMVTEMEYVLGHGVPVAVEGGLAPCWSKS